MIDKMFINWRFTTDKLTCWCVNSLIILIFKLNYYCKGIKGVDACPLNPLIPIWLILGFVLFFPISCIQMKFKVEKAIK